MFIRKNKLILIALSLALITITSCKKDDEDKKYDEYFEYFKGYATDFSDDISGSNPYTELSIAPWSTFSEVKKRYLKLVKKYHPDKNEGNSKDASEKFMRIQKAYDRIKKKRKIQTDEDYEESVMKNLLNILTERMLSIIGILGLLAIIKGSLWLFGVIFDFVNTWVFNFLIAHLVIDTFLSHLITNNNHLLCLEFGFALFVSYLFRGKKRKSK